MINLLFAAFILLSSTALYADTLDRPDPAFVGGFIAVSGSADHGETWSDRYVDNFVQFRGQSVIYGGKIWDCTKIVGTYKDGVRYNLFFVADGSCIFIICRAGDRYLIQVIQGGEELFRVTCVK